MRNEETITLAPTALDAGTLKGAAEPLGLAAQLLGAVGVGLAAYWLGVWLGEAAPAALESFGVGFVRFVRDLEDAVLALVAPGPY